MFVPQIRESPVVFEPLTKLQCCPTSDGGAAAVVASEEFVRRNGLEDRGRKSSSPRCVIFRELSLPLGQ